jgi:hypothetical protein
MMINYKTFYILQHGTKFLILDEDKMPIDVQETLAKAKHLIDTILENIPDIEEIAS